MYSAMIRATVWNVVDMGGESITVEPKEEHNLNKAQTPGALSSLFSCSSPLWRKRWLRYCQTRRRGKPSYPPLPMWIHTISLPCCAIGASCVHIWHVELDILYTTLWYFVQWNRFICAVDTVVVHWEFFHCVIFGEMLSVGERGDLCDYGRVSVRLLRPALISTSWRVYFLVA